MDASLDALDGDESSLAGRVAHLDRLDDAVPWQAARLRLAADDADLADLNDGTCSIGWGGHRRAS